MTENLKIGVNRFGGKAGGVEFKKLRGTSIETAPQHDPVLTLTTYRFRPEVVDGGRLGMVEARSWTERVLGWVGSSMRPGASAGCWASGCRGNARRNGRTSRFWLRPC